MDVAGSSSWIKREIGGEELLERISPGARFLLGRGPCRRREDQENRAAALLAALHPEVGALRWCRQVHGRILASLSADSGRALTSAACIGRCDGLITAEAGLGLLVWTADCTPVLMAGGGVVAAVHVGWRGAAAGIVAAAVRRLWVEYGVHADDLTVVLGPAVGACHYQVGPEVVEALRRTGLDQQSWLEGDRVDLRSLISAELESLGVRAERVERVGRCTSCDPDLASYRRDGERAGRQLSLVVRSP